MLKRSRPLDEMAETSELLERELENGVQIEWVTSDRSRREEDVRVGGVLVIRKDSTAT